MFNSPDGGGVPWDDYCNILPGGQQIATVLNAVETLPKISIARVGCTNVTDRKTTDRRQQDGRRHIANVNVSSRSLKTMTPQQYLLPSVATDVKVTPLTCLSYQRPFQWESSFPSWWRWDLQCQQTLAAVTWSEHWSLHTTSHTHNNVLTVIRCSAFTSSDFFGTLVS